MHEKKHVFQEFYNEAPYKAFKGTETVIDRVLGNDQIGGDEDFSYINESDIEAVSPRSSDFSDSERSLSNTFTRGYKIDEPLTLRGDEMQKHIMSGPIEDYTPQPGISAKLESLNDALSKTGDKIQLNITNYRMVLLFAKKLYESYEINMKNTMKITKLLNDYSHFFGLLKESITKLDKSIIGLNKEDIIFIENMTNETNINFFKSAISQTEKLKEIYEDLNEQSGMDDLDIGINRMNELLKTSQEIKPIYI